MKWIFCRAGCAALFLMCSICSAEEAIDFLIVIPSYNNNHGDKKEGNWIERCLESVFSQKNKDKKVRWTWTITYINDASTDGTGEAAEDYAKKRGMQDRCTFINNEKNRGALANLYDVISPCPPRKVIVLLDGDDALTKSSVLDRVAREYLHHDAWITYGSYVQWPGGAHGLCGSYSSSEMKHRRFRYLRFRTSHLRTFRAKLFQNINPNDLKRDGVFCKGGWDLAIMFPMLEMASRGGHIRYIKEILYLWNHVNPISDNRIHLDEQAAAVAWVRTLPPYPALRRLFKEDSKKERLKGKSSSTEFWNLMKKDTSIAHQRRVPTKGWNLYAASYSHYLAYKDKLLQKGCERIPHKIHLVWLGSPMPDFSRRMVESWKAIHPDWEVKLWTDADLPSIKLKNQAAFDASNNWGEKSDILRYEILLHEGGLYADAADFECLRRFDDLHATCDFFAGIAYGKGSHVYNGLIGCRPNHPVMKQCIASIKKGNGDQSRSRIVHATGPLLLSKCLKRHLASQSTKAKGDISVAFPTVVFYPFPEGLRRAFSSIDLVKKQFAYPEAYAIHYWSSSWAPSRNPKPTLKIAPNA
jgi:mannosyltransferase OCH1-like enzyme